MIRLIDVDKLEHEYEQFNYYLTYSDCLEELRKAPLVDAIPLEWVKKWIPKNEERYALGVNPVRDLLKDWEKEKCD